MAFADQHVRRASGGAAPDWAALIDAHGPRVWSLCRRLDPQPDDAAQEVWLRVARGLPTFDPGGAATLGTWIGRVAWRHLIDRQRRRAARPEAPLLDEPAGEDPQDLHERTDAHRRLDAALRRLPDEQRRAVVLHHVEGVDLAEIAAAEGVPVGTIKSRLHRGRARLATLLEEP